MARANDAIWPKFMVQVQEIRKPTNEPDNHDASGMWRPPRRHEERRSQGRIVPINRRVFYCNGVQISPVPLGLGRLSATCEPLTTYSLYYNERYIYAQEDDVLGGRGALGRTYETFDPLDEVPPEAWRHINFQHRRNPDNSSFVGLTGNQTYLQCHRAGSRWMERLIPFPYRQDPARQRTPNPGGLDGEFQLLLGLIRISESPFSRDLTGDAEMVGGRWHFPAGPPDSTNRRGLVVRVWTVPGHSTTGDLIAFGNGETGTVFA